MPGLQRAPSGVEEAEVECAAGARARGRAASASALETTEPGWLRGLHMQEPAFQASRPQGFLGSGETDAGWKPFFKKRWVFGWVPPAMVPMSGFQVCHLSWHSSSSLIHVGSNLGKVRGSFNLLDAPSEVVWKRTWILKPGSYELQQ